jgi:hypothetical protein
MSLLLRINLVVGVVSVVAGVRAAWCCWTILEGNARRLAIGRQIGRLISFSASGTIPR